MSIMLFSVTVIPMGRDDSIADDVVEVVQRIEDSGLLYEVNGMSTVIEGRWDEVMSLLRQTESALRERHGRVFMMITVDDHAGVGNRLHRAADEVEARLVKPLPLS